eukprot:SAG31_NODE_5661_length_2398_cov_2.414093_3_plen_67_part_01
MSVRVQFAMVDGVMSPSVSVAATVAAAFALPVSGVTFSFFVPTFREIRDFYREKYFLVFFFFANYPQ